MKLITFEDIKNLQIPYRDCFDWVSEMIQNKKDVILPPKISLKPMDGVFCNVMPSIIKFGEDRYGGVKVVTRYPGREPSLDSQMMLMNAESGEFLAVMDANWITAMRTGAVAAHSIVHLAKSDYSIIGMVGLGNTARASLLLLATAEPDRAFHVKLLKYKGQEISFANRFAEYTNIKFTFVDDMISLVKDSDVIISCITYTADDLCPDEYFKKGVLVVPVHTRGFTNCDLFFDKVFADDYGHVKGFKYFDKYKYFAEVADVVNGTAEGRINDEERILAYNIGLSMHDVNYAAHIYEMIKNNPSLQEIDFKSPTDKFWI